MTLAQPRPLLAWTFTISAASSPRYCLSRGLVPGPSLDPGLVPGPLTRTSNTLSSCTSTLIITVTTPKQSIYLDLNRDPDIIQVDCNCTRHHAIISPRHHAISSPRHPPCFTTPLPQAAAIGLALPPPHPQYPNNAARSSPNPNPNRRGNPNLSQPYPQPYP